MSDYTYTLPRGRAAQLGDIVRKSAGDKLYRVVGLALTSSPQALLRGVESGGSFWVDGGQSLVLVEPAHP